MIDCSYVWRRRAYQRNRCVDPARILAFHLDDLEDGPKAITFARRLLPGLGVIPLADIFQRLQKLGYNGDCSVELFRPEYWVDPKEPAIRVRNSAMAVLSLPYFEVE
jgi:2-keto-myo-inositol isomerase